MVHANLPPKAASNLAATLEHWLQNEGCEFAQLPWVTGEKYLSATRPPHVRDPREFLTDHGGLLASGEQAFLQLLDEGRLVEGKCYIGWTPCFRREPCYDELHHFYFLKAELFSSPDEDPRIVREKFICGSYSWFRELLCGLGIWNRCDLRVERVNEAQQDITLNGVEVGSYGIRVFEGRPIVYGTAMAEPRFSTAAGVTANE